MEAIILKISWHYWTMKIRKNRQTKHVEKKLIISNDNHNSNNNDLRDRQNHRLEKKWTLIWITNWLGLLRVWRIQALHDKQFKTTARRKEKNIKNNGIYNTCHGLLSQEWIDGRYLSSLWYVMLTKVMNST